MIPTNARTQAGCHGSGVTVRADNNDGRNSGVPVVLLTARAGIATGDRDDGTTTATARMMPPCDDNG